MNLGLPLLLGSVRAGGGGGGGAILGAAPSVTLTSAPTAYPPTIALAFPGGLEEIGDTVTLKRFNNPTNLTVWPNLAAPDVTQTFTLSTTVANLQTAINAALAGIASGTGLIYLTHTPAGGSESYHSLAALYGVGTAPTLVTSSFNQLGDTPMAQTVVFSHPVEAYPALVDGDKVELFPIKPDGTVATEFEAPHFAYSPRWRLRWLDDGVQDFYNPGDFNGNNTFEVGFDLIRSANTLTAVAENRALTITVTENDTTAPVWTTLTAHDVVEDQPLAIALAATDLNAVTYSIAGGANAADFEVSGTTLRFASNGTRAFGTGPFVVTVRATDSFGNGTNRTITVSVIESVPASHYANAAPAEQSIAYASNVATFTGVNIGAANSNRVVLVWIIGWQGAQPSQASGVTINGVSATRLHSTNLSSEGALWAASVPTGSSVNVVVTGTSTWDTVQILVESILTRTPTPAQLVMKPFGSPATTTVSATTPTDGITLAFLSIFGGVSSLSWTGATSLTQSVTPLRRLNSAVRTTAGTANVTATIGSPATDSTMFVVSYGP